MVNYLYTGVMESYEGDDHELFQELLDVYVFGAQYSVTFKKKTSSKSQNSKKRKVDQIGVVGANKLPVKIKREITSTDTTGEQSFDDLDYRGETGNNDDNKMQEDKEQTDKDQSKCDANRWYKINHVSDMEANARPDGDEMKIKEEIESEDESDNQPTKGADKSDGDKSDGDKSDGGKSDGGNDWMQDMEKEYVEYKKIHECDVCKDGSLSSKEEIDHFYEVWMEKGGRKPQRKLGGWKKANLQCLVCGKICKSSLDLYEHTLIHTGEAPPCSTSMDPNDKSKEVKEETDNEDKIEKPPKKDTDKKEARKDGEDDWMQDMEKEFVKYKERHECAVCENGFPSSKEEIDHFYEVWMEQGEKRKPEFLCNICGKTFKYRSLLESHTRIHTGEKIVHCSVCNKGFNHKGHLKVHMQKHSSGKLTMSPEPTRIKALVGLPVV